MGRTLDEIDDILCQKDQKIEELEATIKRLTYEDEWSWRQVRILSDAENLDLPIPRLEIRHRASPHTHFIDYGLVIKHLMGDINFIPLGSTRVSGVRQQESMYLPFRDGAHIYNEMFELNLQGFIVDGEKYKEITLADKEVPWSVHEKITKRHSEGG